MIPYVKKHQFWFTFFPATHILIFSTLYFLLNVPPFSHQYLIDDLSDNNKNIFKASSCILVLFYEISYLQATFIKNQISPIPAPR